jgi:hypothetical protein
MEMIKANCPFPFFKEISAYGLPLILTYLSPTFPSIHENVLSFAFWKGCSDYRVITDCGSVAK